MIAILSDVHGNAAALESVLTAAAEAGAGKLWFLGDCVGYGARPNECAALLQAEAERAVCGNHDLAALGLIDISDFNSISRQGTLATRALLDAETRRWLESLEPLDAPMPDDEAALFHGSPRDPVWDYLVSPAAFEAAVDLCPNRLIFVGHSHLPFAVRYQPTSGRFTDLIKLDGDWLDIAAERWLINPGSVGQPRDGDSRAAFALFDEERLLLKHCRVEYDIERTQREIIEAGFPQGNAERLAEGR